MQRNTKTALALGGMVLVVAIAGAFAFADILHRRPAMGSDIEGEKILHLKNGDEIAVGQDGKARVNGIPVACKAARKYALSTINVRPFPEEKLRAMVPCRE